MNADQPVEGYYKIRQVRNGPFVPVHVWFGPSRDPFSGEPLDRSPCWHATRRGEDVEVDKVWPWCAKWPITPAEYRYMMTTKEWADTYAPDQPEAQPRRAIDLRNAAPVLPPKQREK